MKQNDQNTGTEADTISDAEWQVAKVIWAKHPLTAAEIIQALQPSADWNPKTIHTLIHRLAQKKIIAAEEGVTPYRYYPLIDEEECEKEKSRSFLSKIYNGSLSLMVSQFVNNKMLTEEEIDKLKKILNGK